MGEAPQKLSLSMQIFSEVPINKSADLFLLVAYFSKYLTTKIIKFHSKEKWGAEYLSPRRFKTEKQWGDSINQWGKNPTHPATIRALLIRSRKDHTRSSLLFYFLDLVKTLQGQE